MSAMLTAKIVLAAINTAIASGTKATDTFRKFVGFPNAAPEEMEARYAEVLALCETKSPQYGAIKQLMAACRKTCSSPYSKAGGKIIPAPAKAKGADKKAKPEVKTIVEPLSDQEIIVRVGALANQFLKADDRAVMARLLTAISNQLKLATTSKK